MYRAIPRVIQAEPFRTLAEAQNVHVELVEHTRAIQERYGNANYSHDREVGVELAQLRRRIRSFEWRLAATGASLPDGQQRIFAQSLLDFWAVQQADLRALSGKFRSRTRRSSRAARSAPASGCLLVPYDERTAAETAERAEATYLALPDDAVREAAHLAFVGLVVRGEQPPPSGEPALASFVEAGVLARQEDGPNAPTYAIGHEALPSAWPRLAEWIEKDRREQLDRERLKADAEAWKQSKSSAELPRGEGIDRAARYSEQDESLTDYVVAARKARAFERHVRILVLAVIGGLIGLLVFNWLMESPLATSGKNAQVSDEIEANWVTAEVLPTAAPHEDASPNGLIGWIWIGSPGDAKVQGEDGTSVDLETIKAGTRVRTIPNLKVRSDRPDDTGANVAGRRLAGVSGGTVAVALENSEVREVKGTRQFWLKVRLLPVVYIQLDKSSEISLDGLRKALATNGFTVPHEERLPNIARPDASPRFDVRYYYQQDEPAALRVSQIVARSLGAGPAPPLTSLVNTPLAERVSTGTIEVWLYQ